MPTKVFVTGACGFVGFNVVKSFLESGFDVIGVDNLQASYGSQLPVRRNEILMNDYNFKTKIIDIRNLNLRETVEMMDGSSVVIHLAAWPGVRFSREKPYDYTTNNVNTFNLIIEAARILNIKKFLYASSSSIYGNLGISGPVKEGLSATQNVLSYYAMTKVLNEQVASAYKKLFGFQSLGLRLFTVYGPFGRPDMAYWGFLEKIYSGEEIRLYGADGGMRCFTFIDDVIDSVRKIIEINFLNYDVVNITSGKPETALQLINELNQSAGNLKLSIKQMPRPLDDAEKTWGDNSLLNKMIEKESWTSLSCGVSKFVNWYDRYKIGQ